MDIYLFDIIADYDYHILCVVEKQIKFEPWIKCVTCLKNNRIVTGGSRLTIWDIETNKPESIEMEDYSTVNCVILLPHGRLIHANLTTSKII